jgi:predicted patatin/cPLA2 family phospholipase
VTGAEHPVAAVLRERARSQSRPGERTDPHRVALVVEGGGMRGIISVAMCATLQSHGLLPAFDLVTGTSSGALNAAALLAEVADASTVDYVEGFANRKFINPGRLLLGRPVIDVNYVLDYTSDRLDADRHVRTLENPVKLHCVATDIADCAPRRFTGMRTYDELRSVLLASSRLPWIGGDPIEYEGRSLLDGGISEPVALPTALDAGATHVLVLLTRPEGTFEGLSGGFGQRLVERQMHKLNPGLVPLLRRRPATYAALMERISGGTRAPEPNGPAILGLWPSPSAPQPSGSSATATSCAARRPPRTRSPRRCCARSSWVETGRGRAGARRPSAGGRLDALDRQRTVAVRAGVAEHGLARVRAFGPEHAMAPRPAHAVLLAALARPLLDGVAVPAVDRLVAEVGVPTDLR